MMPTVAELQKYWDQGAPFAARGFESLFSIHIRARQLLRKLYRRDKENFPKDLEFKFIDQRVGTIYQSYAYTKGDTIIEVLQEMWKRKAIIAIRRNEHRLEYTYLTPTSNDAESDDIIAIS